MAEFVRTHQARKAIDGGEGGDGGNDQRREITEDMSSQHVTRCVDARLRDQKNPAMSITRGFGVAKEICRLYPPNPYGNSRPHLSCHPLRRRRYAPVADLTSP